MDAAELKQLIEQKTGLPAQLLTSENREEILAQARTFLTWKAEQKADPPQSGPDQFAAIVREQLGLEEPPDTSIQELNIIEDSFANYPKVQDGGAVDLPYKGSTKEQFAEWAQNKINVYNPFEDSAGWKRIN